MSYIRCLGNPEGLYIWGGVDGINISTGNGWDHSNIGPDNPIMLVPCDAFEEACKAFYLGCEREFVAGDFSVEEVEVKDHPVFPYSAIKLKKGDLFALLWPVTWEVVCARVCGRNE